jgi:hypothetical protein
MIWGKAMPLQAWTSPKASRKMKLPDYKICSTWRWLGCQPYLPTFFTTSIYSWYSFLLAAESTPGPVGGRKDEVNEKSRWHHRQPATFRLVAQWLNQLRHRVSHVINDTSSCTWPRKKSHETKPSSFRSNTYAYAVSSACILPFIASQRGQGKGPLDVDDNTGRCFFSAYRLRLQLPLRYISFPGSKIITWLSLPPFVRMEWQDENKVERQNT